MYEVYEYFSCRVMRKCETKEEAEQIAFNANLSSDHEYYCVREEIVYTPNPNNTEQFDDLPF